MTDDGDTRGIFVRFKQHVDHHIASGFGTVFPSWSPARPVEDDCQNRKRANRRNVVARSDSCQEPLENSTTDTSQNLSPADRARRAARMEMSSYSPDNLTHLRPPRAKDLENPELSHIMTFRDAFEDLLAASFGRPMCDLLSTSMKNAQEATKLDEFEPDLQHLLQHLFARGLLRNRTTWPESAWRHSDGVPTEQRNPEEQAHSTLWDELARFEQQAVEMNRAAQTSVLTALGLQDTSVDARAPEDGETVLAPWRRLMEINRTQAQENHQEGKHVPQTEMDLYDKIHFILTPRRDDQAVNSDDPTTRQERTVDEHHDNNGYVHRQETIKTYDNQGNVVGRQTHYSMISSERSRILQALRDEAESSRIGQQVDTREITPARRGGWFWK